METGVLCDHVDLIMSQCDRGIGIWDTVLYMYVRINSSQSY